MKTEHDNQADAFLATHGIKCRIALSNSKPAHWEPAGNHYRVTLSQPGARMTFDFWGSLNDAKAGKDPSAYDILACISGDVFCPQDFSDFCSEYGYDADSIKAKQTFTRASRFAARLNQFFTPEQIEALSEIR